MRGSCGCDSFELVDFVLVVNIEDVLCLYMVLGGIVIVLSYFMDFV